MMEVLGERGFFSGLWSELILPLFVVSLVLGILIGM